MQPICSAALRKRRMWAVGRLRYSFALPLGAVSSLASWRLSSPVSGHLGEKGSTLARRTTDNE